MSNNKSKSDNNSKCLIMNGTKAALIGFVVMLILYLLTSVICIKSDSFNLKAEVVSYIVFAFSAFISGSVTAFCKCDKKIFACLVSVFVLLVLSFILLTVISDFSLQIKSLLLIPISVVFAIMGCFLFKNKKRRH